MATFYLDEPAGRIPAHGLYHYTATAAGLEERIIEPDGQPAANQTQTIPAAQLALPAEQTWPPPNDILPSNWQDWLVAPGAAVKQYLALKPFAQAKPVRIWRGAFTPLPGNRFAIPLMALRATPMISRDLQKAGYARAFAKTRAAGVTALVQNAAAFWEAGHNICEKLIEHIEYSLGANGARAPYNLDPFTLPAAIFQLNRIVAEGFIEGHAQAPFGITVSGHYNVTSRNDWSRTLNRVSQGITRDAFEQLGSGQMAQADRDIWNDERRVLDLLPLTLKLLAPGASTSQEFAFWYLHYPHWYKDLLSALRTMNDQGIMISDADFDIIKHIILRNYPRRSESLSVWDRIFSSALEVLDSAAEVIGLGGATTSFIDPIFDDLIGNI